MSKFLDKEGLSHVITWLKSYFITDVNSGGDNKIAVYKGKIPNYISIDNVPNSNHSYTSDISTKATQDGNGNTITSTYATKNEVSLKLDSNMVGNEANKVPKYNSEGHLVLPSGIEIY